MNLLQRNAPKLQSRLEEICLNPALFRSKTPYETTHPATNKVVKATIWVYRVQAQSSLETYQAAQDCEDFIMAGGRRGYLSAWVFGPPSDDRNIQMESYILVAEIKLPPETNYTARKMELVYSDNSPWWMKWSSGFRYMRLDTASTRSEEVDEAQKVQGFRFRLAHLFIGLVALLLTAAIFIFVTQNLSNLASAWPDDGYIRYRTTGSEGPRHQARIYHTNATEWSRSNPHDNGEWKIRMDDQALIPASAWDEEEDRFQAWYHARYPEMRDVIRTKKFLRPSWLGSLDIIVPWDKEFHFGHCVLTLRRYWKAKESGKHVCPRDIDYLHIQHCLNWFEGMVFSDDPQGVPEMGTHMIWQTKVCF